MPSTDERIEILRDLGALREGHFALASGAHSEHYVQTAQLMEHPRRAAGWLRDAVAELDLPEEVDLVLTAAKGGITVAQQLALELGTRALFAERGEDDELLLKRGFEIQPGDRVLLVEDVVTTGGTLLELRDLAESKGGRILGGFALINRSGQDRVDGVTLHSLVPVDYPVYSPEECPRCDGSSPAERPGTKQAQS